MSKCQINCNYPDGYGTPASMDIEVSIEIHLRVIDANEQPNIISCIRDGLRFFFRSLWLRFFWSPSAFT